MDRLTASRTPMIAYAATIWTSQADQLPVHQPTSTSTSTSTPTGTLLTSEKRAFVVVPAVAMGVACEAAGRAPESPYDVIPDCTQEISGNLGHTSRLAMFTSGPAACPPAFLFIAPLGTDNCPTWTLTAERTCRGG